MRKRDAFERCLFSVPIVMGSEIGYVSNAELVRDYDPGGVVALAGIFEAFKDGVVLNVQVGSNGNIW